MPRIDLYELNVYTTYPGASPEDVELNVTKKIEEAIESVSNIDKYTSQSMENLSIVHIKIDEACEDLKKVKDDIKDAINDITDFPEEIEEQPEIYEEKSDNWPVLEVGIYTTDPTKQNYIEVAKELRKELINLPTVAKVNHGGVSQSEFHILLNKKKLKKLLISMNEVVNAIRSNKIRLAAGSFESFTSETNLLTLSEFSNPQEIGNIIIRINDVGNLVRLKDIATVKKAYEKQDKILRINGHSGTWISVLKLGQEDILRSVNEIKEKINYFKERYPIPDNVKIVLQRDESINTENKLYILYSNALAGLLLVLIVLFLFFNKRIAFWTAAGIPIAIGIAFIVTSFLGVTINQISLLGLIVVLGMLVDDSIIIAENIYRYKKEYKSPIDAAVAGLEKVVIPVITSIITTIIVFVPFYFMPGVAMDFSREIPTFVIAMLTGSLIEALIILPVHLAHDKEGKESKPIGENYLAALEKKYVGFLENILKHKYKSLTIILIAFVTISILSMFIVNFKMFPIDQSTFLIISAEVKGDSNLNYSSEVAKSVEKIINKLPKDVVKSYRTIIGQKGFYSPQILSNIFKFEIILHPASGRDMTAEQVKNYIFANIKKNNIKEIELLDFYIDGGGPPAGKPVEINVIGNDNEKRLQLLTKLSNDLEKMGLVNVDIDYREGKKELRLVPNYKVITLGQLSVSQIASIIRTAFDGAIVSDHDTAEENIKFRVMLDKKYINKNDPLEGLYVNNNRGVAVPVENLLVVKKSKSTQAVYRYNGKRTNKITASLASGQSITQIYAKILEKYKNFEKENPGFKISMGGEAEESADTMLKMMFSLGLAIIAIYFVLVIQFNSLIQPVMVISAIPFGLLGIFMAFGLQRYDLSLLAIIGIIGYSGVVVNNSLIMVDFINKSRMEKGDFIKILVTSASSRFKPIFLTTLTTVVGLFPTAYGFFGGYDTFVSPMVMAMAWGLIVGAPSVLIIIPLFYLFLEDIRKKFRKVL